MPQVASLGTNGIRVGLPGAIERNRGVNAGMDIRVLEHCGDRFRIFDQRSAILLCLISYPPQGFRQRPRWVIEIQNR